MLQLYLDCEKSSTHAHAQTHTDTVYEGLLAIPAPSIRPTEQQHGAFADAPHLVAERYTLAPQELLRRRRIRVHRMDQTRLMSGVVMEIQTVKTKATHQLSDYSNALIMSTFFNAFFVFLFVGTHVL